MLLSLKCKIYRSAGQAHAPCSGTTDDGTGRPCECECHGTAIRLPAGYGQIIYEGYRSRARAMVGDDVLRQPWGELTPDDQKCWDGAAADLAAYLDRIPR